MAAVMVVTNITGVEMEIQNSSNKKAIVDHLKWTHRRMNNKRENKTGDKGEGGS